MRTMVQINNDYNVCKKYVDEHPFVTSLKEVAQGVSLSESQVVTSLSRHPRVFARIMKQIEANKEANKLRKKSVLKAEAGTNQKNSKNKCMPEKDKMLEDSMNFVIDASIAGNISVLDMLREICATKAK